MLKRLGIICLCALHLPLASGTLFSSSSDKCSLKNCADRESVLVGQLSAAGLVEQELHLPPGHGKDLVGVSFSGGGSRSLSLVSGQLAALKLLGLEKEVNYYSAVSGGAWAIVVYLAQKSEAEQEVLLGEPVLSEGDLCLGGVGDDKPENLSRLEPGSLGSAPGRMSTYEWLVFYFVVGILNPLQVSRQVWREILAEVLLQPYGIDGSKPLTESSFDLHRSDLQVVISAALRDDNGRLYPFEMTSRSMGVRARTDDVGGYMPAPEDFGKKLFVGADKSFQLGGEKSGFCLADMLAVTSANYAHGGGAAFYSWPSLWGRSLMPPSWVVPRYWYPVFESSNKVSNRLFDLIDGGPLDYLGIMPLLGRGVQKLIVFVNTDIPIVAQGEDGQRIVGMEKAIPALFGKRPDEGANNDKYFSLKEDCGAFCVMTKNQVFDDSDYQELADGLWLAKQSKGPAVYLQMGVDVLPNEFYGIEGRYKVDILWVYNELPGRWREGLSDELQTALTEDERFACKSGRCGESGSRFPHFSAMSELNLVPAQVNLLFHKAAWELVQSRGLLNQLLGDQK